MARVPDEGALDEWRGSFVRSRAAGIAFRGNLGGRRPNSGTTTPQGSHHLEMVETTCCSTPSAPRASPLNEATIWRWWKLSAMARAAAFCNSLNEASIWRWWKPCGNSNGVERANSALNEATIWG